jgi:hypothetical protein
VTTLDRSGWFRSLMPDFLGIGAMRSGTTWLATQLHRHPQVQIDRKEIHFFDRTLRRLNPADSGRDLVDRLRYAARIRARSPRGRVRGEITPAYATLDEERVRRIQAWMPQVRIVFLMRDPVERTWSHARKHFPELFGLPVEDVGRDELLAFFDSEGVVGRSDYASCIQRWTRVFPRDQMFIGFFDDVVERPEELLRDLFAFLGVDAETDLSPVTLRQTVGAARSADFPAWVRSELEARYAPQTSRLEALGIRPPWTR